MIVLNGNRNNRNKVALMESQESKSISAAKNLLITKLNYTPEYADKFIRIDLRSNIPVLRTEKGGKFILGVTRMFINKELNSATVINKLNKTLKLLAGAHYDEYDRNLNGLNADDLITRFEKTLKDNSDNEREELNGTQIDGESRYTIIPINSFDDANKYSKYVSWCVTNDEWAFNNYTSDGINQFYFCLRDDYKEVSAIPGENAPLDEYGLSMIAVCVDEDGDLATCTCRWNHDNGGNDDIMTPKEISNVINMNFYNIFKPNRKWADLLKGVKTRLLDGVDPYQIFSQVIGVDGKDGRYFIVYLRIGEDNFKANVLTHQNEFLLDKWYDEISAPASVSNFLTIHDWNREKSAVIDMKGNIIGNAWFDTVTVKKDFIMVYSNDKGWNILKGDGNLLNPDIWFNMISPTEIAGLFTVRNNEKYNFLTPDGNLLSPDLWFDGSSQRFAYTPYSVVKVNNKSNIISSDGELMLPEWCDEVFFGHEGPRVFYEIKKNNKWNILDGETFEFRYNVWFDHIHIVDGDNMLVRNDGQKETFLLTKNGDLSLNGKFIKNIANRQNKEVFITESQMKYLQEMAYPTNFNIEEFKGLTSFAKRVEYCNKRLVFLGQGSSRRVYMVDNEKCLKLAKNRKGIAQNEAENDYCLQQLDLCPTIYNYDRNGLWIEVQIAKKAKASDFKRLTGYGWDVFCAWVDYVATQYLNPKLSRYRGEFREIFESSDFENFLYNNNSIFSKINTYMTDYMLKSYGDLQCLSSWGIVSNNGQEKLVLVDSGLNDIVGREHYGFNV